MPFLVLGGLFGGLSVALGAFGAHVLKPRLDAYYMDVFQTAVQYQMYHAIALVLVAILARQLGGGSLLHAAGWLFVAGTVIFSGSLYVLTLSGVRAWGAITPIGGVMFVVAWILLAISAFRYWNS
jgi:uncharacterized membrane protein YgdD (TMEM256/DUF423 family)